jgi:oligoendopeptidase F
MRRSRFTGVLFAIILAATLVSAAAAQTGAVPQRSEIDNRYKWHLEDIYPDTNSWNADFNRLQEQSEIFAQFEGKLGESADNLYQCLTLRDSLSNVLDRLYVYAHMKKDEDTRLAQYQELCDRVEALSSHFNESVSFIRPEVVAIPSATLENYLANNDKLKMYRFYLEDIIRLKGHILNPEEESLLALSRFATEGPSNIFDMLDNADITFPFVKDDKGKKVQLTNERYYKLLESHKREVRRNASLAYNETYLNYINTLGATLGASVNTDWFYAQARKYKSTLEMDLDSDNIPLSVFDNLIQTVDANLAPLHKWTAIRKREMKLDKIYPYDLSVPLVPKYDMEVPYDSAVTGVLIALQPLGQDYLTDMRNGFKSGWVDVYETEGKTSGAYSWGAYSTHPYVLLNYSNTLEAFSTVAHEMGHAMHTFYSHQNQPYIYESYATFVAEVASTTNEALLINYMINHAQSKAEKMYLLNYYIEQIIGTFYTQVMFSEFERAIHDQVEQGGALSAESMRKIYRDIYLKYWGPDLSMEEWQDLGGLRIPHFYTSYYVFQYATSYCAAQAFSEKILAGDTAARDKYLHLLTMGGSKHPVDELKDAGVDMTQPEAVDATVRLFGQLVDQMDKLLQEK